MKRTKRITGCTFKETIMTLIDTTRALSRNSAHSSARPTLMQRVNLWASRRALAKLDARALNDIGVTRAEAIDEAGKTLWDVPKAWVNC
jgi:uncharacterized protein YjiS (DUF1127 family)